MPLNPYFNMQNSAQQNTETDLLTSLSTEAIQCMGVSVKYLPKTLVNIDHLYGEDPLMQFNDAHEIEMFLENVSGYTGQGQMLQKFGIIINDTSTFHVSSQRFAEEFPSLVYPREGDLIYFKIPNILFEVKYVDKESPFYPLGKRPTFKINCERYSFSMEDINTGDTNVDVVKTQNSLNAALVEQRFGQNTTIQSEANPHIATDEENPFGPF